MVSAVTGTYIFYTRKKHFLLTFSLEPFRYHVCVVFAQGAVYSPALLTNTSDEYKSLEANLTAEVSVFPRSALGKYFNQSIRLTQSAPKVHERLHVSIQKIQSK